MLLVCSVSTSVLKNTFLSSSWDATARLWEIKSESDHTYRPVLLTIFEGHKQAVWSAIQLTSKLVVTGSADKTILIHDILLDDPENSSVVAKMLTGICLFFYKYFHILMYKCLSINVLFHFRSY